MAGELPGRKGPGDVGRLSAEHKPAVCPGGQEGQQHPGLYQEQHDEEDSGGDRSPVLGTELATFQLHYHTESNSTTMTRWPVFPKKYVAIHDSIPVIMRWCTGISERQSSMRVSLEQSKGSTTAIHTLEVTGLLDLILGVC
ncbi:hypothetical protein llap_20867 [Limosa lapponica baueri]|uniref:Uncharacterized protein n=1 Tax=Limosa lapponica baueri TaxID=1758121 RepID=A0A2I0T4Y1_LIMLA|nr:hypothetical protein llap_20867 [Limosa lapponica baueri]